MQALKELMKNSWSYRGKCTTNLTESDKEEIAKKLSSFIVKTEIKNNVAVVTMQEVSK